MKPIRHSSTIQVQIDTLIDNSVTDFPLYLQVDRHPILYSTTGYLWLRDELERLISQGYSEFHTNTEYRNKLQKYLKVNSLEVIKKDLAPNDRIKKIEQIGVAFTKCLREGEITQSCVHKASQIADTLTECVQEQRQCVAALENLVSHDAYVFHHSIRVATYATAIALEMGLEDHAALKDIAFGAMFHDIGKSRVPDSIINKTGVLTEEEWKVMRSHPEIGHSLFEASNMGQVPREIIIHHHERLDGMGYPHGLDKFSLLPEVQIVALADIFDALTSVRAYQKARSKYDALTLIKEKMTGSHIAKDPFTALISCLAIPKTLSI